MRFESRRELEHASLVGRSESLVDAHRPEHFAALFDNQHNRGGWQRWIGKARCAAILAAVHSPTRAQALDERAGMADGPTV